MNVETGVWRCHRCDAHGLLDEHQTVPDDEPVHSGSSRTKGRRWRRLAIRPTPSPGEPSPAEAAERADKQRSLRGLWATTVSIDAPEGAVGVEYLWGRRGIPLWFAAEARVRFSAGWYGRPVVAFPLRDGLGRLVAVEGRYIDDAAPETRSAGPKRAGVFVAARGALEADGVCVCEGPITALSLAVVGRPAIALCGSWPTWLVQRLAFKTVYIAFDEADQGTDRAAKVFARELAMLGSKPWCLKTPQDFEGDWNDVLVAHGRQALRGAFREALGRAGV